MRVTIYPTKGGNPIQRHSIDARGMVASGEFSYTPVEAPAAAPEPEAAPEYTVEKKGKRWAIMDANGEQVGATYRTKKAATAALGDL